ncbi:MAG: helix-turn-helix transcriptional regulator [Clostridia bacterium]|nr:helix-turn-helix transcriptional regulator [Clostridia bacterium]
MNFYQRIRDLREDRDLNQETIAKILNISQSDYSKYELGKHMMGIDKYIILAKYYNVSIDYLAGIIDVPEKLNRF